MIDMTNWYMKEHGIKNSKWKVLEYCGNSKWKCQCECGTIKEVLGSSLRNGNSKSCGKCGSKKNKTIDMTGWNMWEHGIPESKITVIKQLPTEGGHALWECKCNCGNPITFKVDGGNLRSGHTLSCGCIRKGQNHKDRSNTYHNDIFIGQIVGINNQGSYLYDCICHCGNHFISDSTRIINGHVQSCGCLNSKGEEKISNLLKNMGISFEREYKLFDLLSEKGNPRRMDFAIFKNSVLKCFIEYQGEQHYNKNSAWYSGDIDKIKREYCKNKNIPLIEIAYTDYEKITEEYLIKKLEDNKYEF